MYASARADATEPTTSPTDRTCVEDGDEEVRRRGMDLDSLPDWGQQRQEMRPFSPTVTCPS